MNKPTSSGRAQSTMLRRRLAEAEDMLRAIRQGDIDALVVDGPHGNQIYTLHSADEPYRALVDQMQEGAVVLTDRRDILYANRGFAALVDEPLESVVGGHFDRFVNPSDRNNVDALFNAVGGRLRCRLRGSDSSEAEVGLSLTRAGTRWNLIVTDLSSLLEAHSNRDIARRENRTKDEFLATFGHELRNPLSAIGAAAQVLETTRVAGGVGSNRPYDVIARQVAHMSRLITDLLDVERVVFGKVRLSRQPVDIAEALRYVVAAVTGSTGKDREITLSTEPVWVEWDPDRLQQVLTNIMTNAVKYTPLGGQIRVSVRAEGGEAVLTVQDTGFGISPAVLPFIFDMFVQVDRTLDHARGGLGLGLALVRGLVELHGGTVVASSDGEGHGSTFTVRLKQTPAPGPSVESPFALERRARPRHVLLIEDSADARQRLRLMLELAGHVVYDVPDVAGGLELLKTVRPDVGIVSISSPIVDGSRVATLLRNEPNGRGLLLVALNAPDALNSSIQQPVDGFDLHFVYPIGPEHLARLLGGDDMQALPAGS